MKYIIVALVFCSSVFGATKTLLTCGRDVKGSMYFEMRESPSEYEFEFRETGGIKDPNESVIFGLLHARTQEGHRYHVVLTAPKEKISGGFTIPTCREMDASTVACMEIQKTRAVIKDIDSGQEHLPHLSSLTIYTQRITEEWVTNFQEFQSKQRLALRSNLQAKERGLDDVECKIGEP